MWIQVIVCSLPFILLVNIPVRTKENTKSLMQSYLPFFLLLLKKKNFLHVSHTSCKNLFLCISCSLQFRQRRSLFIFLHSVLAWCQRLILNYCNSWNVKTLNVQRKLYTHSFMKFMLFWVITDWLPGFTTSL